MAIAPEMPARPAAGVGRFVFLLLDRFTLMSFAAALEPLRLANRMAGKTIYSWRLVGEGGGEVCCSNGTVLRLDGDLGPVARDETVLVCGGLDVGRAATRPVLSWLRRAARGGAPVGGLCTGAHVLARAGLLDGRTTTIHWENQDGFAEEFPEVTLSEAVFAIDGNRLSAAGGIASVDLMLRLISADHGPDLASVVADQLVHAAIRTDRDVQRLSIPARIGVRHPKLAQVIAMMESHIEEPVSPARLATGAGLSTRQLERLFRRYLGRSPKRYYMELRLQKARNLLMQTGMSVMNVALACGFASPSHFSKCYRASYGTTPYRERGTQAVAPRAGEAKA